MNEGSTGSGDAGHYRWKPATPVSTMVVDRLVLGLPSVVGLTTIVLVWSTLTHAGSGFDRVCVFSLVAAAIRELIDASTHRLIMRAWRLRDPHGLLPTIITATCSAVAGFLAARLLASAPTTALAVLTRLPFMAFVALIKRSWDTPPGYDALQERTYQPQPILLECVTADFRDTHEHPPELRCIARAHAALQPAAPAAPADLNCDDDHRSVRVRERHL